MAQQQSMAELFDLAPLMFTVEGLKKSFAAKLGVNNLAWAFHNNWKQTLRASKGDGTAYPHGNFKLTGVEVGSDPNIRNIARVGSGHNTTVTQNNASIRKFYLFPVKLTFDFEVKFQDVKQGIQFAMAANVLTAISELSFYISYMGDRWNARVSNAGTATGNIPFPTIDDLNEGSTPGTAAIQFQLTVDTKLGFVRDTNKLNNLGEVNINADLATKEEIATRTREFSENLSDDFFAELQKEALTQQKELAAQRAAKQAALRTGQLAIPLGRQPNSPVPPKPSIMDGK